MSDDIGEAMKAIPSHMVAQADQNMVASRAVLDTMIKAMVPHMRQYDRARCYVAGVISLARQDIDKAKVEEVLIAAVMRLIGEEI